MSEDMNQRGVMSREAKYTVAAVAIVVVVALVALWGWPQYRVWSNELRGQATLREAEWDRQVAVEEARAQLESAKLLREAELERALGLAEAIAAVKEELSGAEGEAYLRYRWIEGLHDGSSEVIYIATEGGLPILEAGRSLASEGR